MSWKPEVIADSSGTWHGNALRFASQIEAEQYAADLMYRRTSVLEIRVIESTDPANHRWGISGVTKLAPAADWVTKLGPHPSRPDR